MPTGLRARFSSFAAPALALAALLVLLSAVALPARAGTTGTISGTVTDPAGKRLAGITVSAAAPSQSQKTTTNGEGFYTLQNLSPDTYTVSFGGAGFQTFTVQGVTVQQDITATVDQTLSKQLQTIGRVTANSPQNLVKGTQGTDVYNVSGQQLNVASGGDDLHRTLYEYIATAPGVTFNGFPGLPRIRGGSATDTGYEFDGIPIRERITGLFTSNLSSIGFANIEVYTGGLSAANAGYGTGIINTVVKSGTYPGFQTIATGLTAGEMNHYLTLEKGGATRDNRLSYYVSADLVNSQNDYDFGKESYPNVLYHGSNGPGSVITRDLIGNFHYRPNQNDDVQFLIQNGVGEFNYNYLLGYGSHLALAPCGGNQPLKTSPTGFTGGTAPNGAACPGGLYFQSLPPNTGNAWHHYSGIGKLQWNHIINDHSGLTFRLAENFNQYIFDQPISDPNYASDNQHKTNPGCPDYPYAAGTPVAVAGGKLCSQGIEVDYDDRRSNMYFGSLDYTTTPNEHATYRVGINQEYDDNLEAYYSTYGFNSDGTWPQRTTTSIVPTHFPSAYVDATFNTGRFTLEPGLRYSEGHYFFPGSHPVTMLTPTFAGTYRANPANVVRFSYSDTSNFIGSAYVYRQFSSTYDPTVSDGAYGPQINHSAEIMLEHAFDPATSLRVGPWVRKTSNYFALYRPFLGLNATGAPQFGPTQPTDAGANQAFGVELGLNHVDSRPSGVSAFLSAEYQNYWTTAISSLTGSYGASQLPSNLVAQGIRIRSTDDPLLNATLALDAHFGQWSLLPLFTYQTKTFYNVGITANGQITQPEQIAGAHWVANATLLRRLDPKGHATAGVRVTNLFNNLNDTTPCLSDGTGCNPFNGPYSGVTTAKNQFIYQNYSQNPRLFEFFVMLRQF